MSVAVELLDRIAEDLFASVISDVLDGLGNRNHALSSRFAPLDPAMKLVGPATTMQLVEAFVEPERPYEGLIAAMDRIPRGSIVVIAAGSTTRCGLWGELFSTAAQARGARGTLVEGYVRDSAKVMNMDYPLFALGTNPLDSRGRAEFLADRTIIEIDGIAIAPDDLVFADRDGVVIVPSTLERQVIDRAYEKLGKESLALSALANGDLMKKVWDEHQVL